MGDNHVVAGAIPAIQTSRFTTVLETGRDSAKIDGGGATPPGGASAGRKSCVTVMETARTVTSSSAAHDESVHGSRLPCGFTSRVSKS